MSSQKPTPDQVRLAIDWLESYDSADGPEGEDQIACITVATWLRAKLPAMDTSAAVKELADKHGVSTKMVRAAIKKAKA